MTRRSRHRPRSDADLATIVTGNLNQLVVCYREDEHGYGADVDEEGRALRNSTSPADLRDRRR